MTFARTARDHSWVSYAYHFVRVHETALASWSYMVTVFLLMEVPITNGMGSPGPKLNVIQG